MPDTESRRRFIVNILWLALLTGLIYLTFRHVLGLIWPFVVAWLFAWLLRRPVRWLTAKRHVKYHLSVALCLTVFFSVLGGLAALAAARLAALASELALWLPSLYEEIVGPALTALFERIEALADRVSPELYAAAKASAPDVLSSVGSAVTDASMQLVSALSGLAARLPRFLVSVLVCVIATIFLTADYPRVMTFLARQLPERPKHVLLQARESFAVILRRYGKGYGAIMGITFAELLTGLLLLRQENAVPIAVAIAVFDIFPIVGAGMILVPWGIVTLLGGGVGKGVGLLVLWLVVIVVRQVIEPRIVGRQVGLPPLVTLLAMFVGLRLFGGAGLLGLPIACAVVQSLDESGVIRLFRREEDAPKE